MRVLVIIPSGSCFGLQNISFDYIDELKGSCEFSFLISRWSSGEFERRIKERKLPYIITALGFMSMSLKPVNLWMTANYLGRLPWLAWDYLKAIRRFRPQVIWVANYNEIRVIGLFLLFKRIPVVCHMHDPPPDTSFFRAMFRWVSVNVTQYVAITQYVAQRCRSLGCAADRLQVITNGLKVDEFPFAAQRGDLLERRFNWSEKAFIFGITGQMMPEKGHEILLQAFRICSQENSAIRLVIGAKDPDLPYARHLQSLIDEWRLGDWVRFSGWMDHPRQFYQNIDSIVMPSLLKEGFGLALAEGMLSGCSAIASNHGGLVEVVDEGRVGLVFESGNVAGLVQVMNRLASDPILHQELRLRGRKHVAEKFNLQKQAKAFNSVMLKAAAAYV